MSAPVSGMEEKGEGGVSDPLKQPYCCPSCRWKGRMGQLMATDTLRCPVCNSADVYDADGQTHTTPVWHGGKPESVQ